MKFLFNKFKYVLFPLESANRSGLNKVESLKYAGFLNEAYKLAFNQNFI